MKLTSQTLLSASLARAPFPAGDAVGRQIRLSRPCGTVPTAKGTRGTLTCIAWPEAQA